MRISVEFDSMEEFEQFRVSGKKTRGKKDEVDEVPQQVSIAGQGLAATPAPAVQPIATPPDVQQHLQASGFPGGNGQMPAPQHKLVTAILARIDGALTSGQAAEAIVTWFRQQIGPAAAQATLDQIKQVFVPRMSEVELKQLAPQLGIPTE